MMPLIAMTAFLKTELVFAALGVLRRVESVTVTTAPNVGRSRAGHHVNAR
jgi:hypothetical protein